MYLRVCKQYSYNNSKVFLLEEFLPAQHQRKCHGFDICPEPYLLHHDFRCCGHDYARWKYIEKPPDRAKAQQRGSPRMYQRGTFDARRHYYAIHWNAAP